MEKQEDLGLEMSLLRGGTVQFERISIRPLTLGEIEEMGLEKYLGLINFTNLSKEKLVGKDLIEVFKPYSFYQIVVNYEELRETFLEFLRTFVLHDKEENSIRYVPEIDTIVVRYNKINGKINNSNFQDFLDFIRKVYHVPKTQKESERVDIDEEMAELLKEFEEAESKVAKESGNEITITSMIEAICVKHPSINLMTIWNYTMYQFMKTFYRIEQIDSAKNIMTGIYSGCIESKKINLKEYHWAKKLE